MPELDISAVELMRATCFGYYKKLTLAGDVLSMRKVDLYGACAEVAGSLSPLRPGERAGRHHELVEICRQYASAQFALRAAEAHELSWAGGATQFSR